MTTSNDDKPSLASRVRALITWPTDGISIDECLEIIDRSMGNSAVLLREISSLEVNPAGTMARMAELESKLARLAGDLGREQRTVEKLGADLDDRLFGCDH